MMLRKIMQKKVTTISPDTSIREAAKKMKRGRIGYLVITNAQHVKGCVTDRDIATWLADGKDPDATKVDSIMQKKVVSAEPDMDIVDASKLMARRKVRRLPIVEKERLVGLVSTSDLAPIIEQEIDSFLQVEEAYHH